MRNFAAESCICCIYACQKIYTIMKITFPDRSIKDYEAGITPLQIAEKYKPAPCAGSFGGNSRWRRMGDLTRPIVADAAIKLFKWEDPEGKHAFWHTSAHLLAEALQELFRREIRHRSGH